MAETAPASDAPPLPRLGYGTADLGNLHRPMGDDDAHAILTAAWDSGIRYFDTAPHYGLGLAERRLGAFLAGKPRDEYVVSTKVGRLLRPIPNPDGRLDDEGFAVPADHERVWAPTLDGIRRSLDGSLERLRLDRVDIVLLHDPDRYDLDSAESDAYPALQAIRSEGLAGAIGTGSMSVDALERAARAPGLDILMVAGRLTLLEQPARTALRLAAGNGMRVVAAGVFNSGLLATERPGPTDRYEYGSVPPEQLARARDLASALARRRVALPTAALHYPLTFPPVASVVVGGSSAAHVEAASRRMAEQVPAEVWADLVEAGLLGDPS